MILNFFKIAGCSCKDNYDGSERIEKIEVFKKKGCIINGIIEDNL
jgi:hypothetical protein